jgi:hypothetical protein
LVDLSYLYGIECPSTKILLDEYKVKLMTGIPEPVVARHCMLHAIATLQLFYKFYPKINHTYYQAEMATYPVMLKMSERGILIDQEERERIEYCLSEDVKTAEHACLDIAAFNPSSPQQVSYVLAERGAYNVFSRLPFTKDKYGRKTTKLSSDVKVLEAMDDPLAQLVLSYRQKKKLLSTYVVPWKGSDRARTLYHLDAATGRPSSTGGTGEFRNMQNIPGMYAKTGELNDYNCRGMLLPDSGTWTDTDFSQVEPRSLAYLSGDREMQWIFSQPKFLPDGSKNPDADIHGQVATFMNVPRKVGKVINLCVPTTTQALTLNGWKYHHELHVDDFVLGYSAEVESYIWTKVVSVMEPKRAELLRFGNAHTQLTSTAGHRWYGKQRHHTSNKDYYSNEVKTLATMNAEFNITLASYMDQSMQIFNTGHLSNVTEDEASLVAWLYTDGHIGKQQSAASIAQSKQPQIQHIRELLSLVPHVEDKPRDDGVIVWRLAFPWTRNFLVRVGAWNSENLIKFVLGLLPHSRRAFLHSCLEAEGCVSENMNTCGRISRQVSMYQNSGPILDAMQLAASLEGYFTKQLPHPNKQYPNGTNKIIRLRKPTISCQKLQIYDAWTDYVWCMQTGVGSWVARDVDNQIFITGNAMTYGATDETLMETAKIRDKHRASELRIMWGRKFPQAMDWILSVQEQALRTRTSFSAFGRPMRLPSRDEENDAAVKRKAVDFPCQSTAADILKRGLVELDKRGVDLALQIHDEFLCDGYYPETLFECLRNIGPFDTPFELNYYSRWQ